MPVLIGVGCLTVLCVCVILVGGGAAYFYLQETKSPSVFEPSVVSTREVTRVVNTPVPTKPSSPTIESSLVKPTSSPALSGKQQLNDHYLFDDFSSDALEWPLYDDGTTIMKYDNQAYSFHMAKPDYYDWAYFPIDFTANEISFDVKGPSGKQDGTFGIFCQYQDADNYYYVEIDLGSSSYLIGQYLDSKDIVFTGDGDWANTSAFKSPSAGNHIAISCYSDNITLYVNDKWVDSATFDDPFKIPGETAFFVYAFEDAGENGYQVWFDNVEAYKPMQ